MNRRPRTSPESPVVRMMLDSALLILGFTLLFGPIVYYLPDTITALMEVFQ